MAVLLPVSLVLLVTAEIVNRRKRHRDWFARTFRTHERFRAEMDFTELRRVRKERGDRGLVRHLRARYPQLPGAELARLMQEM